MFSGLKMLFLMSATKKEETEYVASGQYMYELDVDQRCNTKTSTKTCYSLISEVRVLSEKRMLITFLCLSFKAFVSHVPKHFLHSNLAIMVMWPYNSYGQKIKYELLSATLVSSFQKTILRL